jgi:hypothetical protein
VGLDHVEEDTNPNQKELVEDLVRRTGNLFKCFYQRASVKDKMSALTDLQIQ